MTVFVVTILNGAGEKVPLRGTVWAFSMDRATRFATREDAQAALDKAKQFMKASVYKRAKIEELPEDIERIQADYDLKRQCLGS